MRIFAVDIITKKTDESMGYNRHTYGMNKIIKKVTLMLFVASAVIAYTACNKENEESNTQSWIVGKWLQTGDQQSSGSEIADVRAYEHYYTFNSNGTVVEQQGQGDTYTVKYRLTGNDLYLYMVDEEGDEEGLSITIKTHDDASMVWEGGENTSHHIQYFEKVN